MYVEMKYMQYSVSQIHNLLRTYPQHLRARPAQQEEETGGSQAPSNVDRISISPEGKRLLAQAETQRSTSR